jgi:ATP-binding cassette subfamily F protein 3
MVQSRIKALNKSEKMDKLEKIKSLEFSFRYSNTQAKSLLHVKDLKFAYDNKNFIVNNLSFSVNKKDRICVIGKNGKGKSTLLKLIAEELKPQSGEILSHPSVNLGYYAQTNVISLNETLTVEEELMSAGCERQQARDICGAMMFEGDNALKQIKVLSGGEKSRVMLGKIIASSSNLLLLDEPTNHLDMESCDAFLAAIDDFEGACIMVTHNETFLHTLAERFIIFQNNGIRVFEGPYQSFLDKVGWEDEEKQNVANSEKNVPEESFNKKELRKIKADILSRKSKELKPLEIKMASLEKQIEENEADITKTNSNLIDASSTEGNGEKIQTLSKNLHMLKTETNKLYDELDKIISEFESKSTMFEDELRLVDKSIC